MNGDIENRIGEVIAQVIGDQNPIGQILSAAFENDVSLTFATFIFVLFSLALVRHFTSRSDQSSTIANASPALLTTIGVLGTFVGIFIGLAAFDVGNIDKSVPELLEGMKVAFVTSILGMSSAVFLRVTYAAFPRSASAESVGPEEIHSILTDIRDGQNSALSEIRSAIAGEDDTSMVTQLQKLRTSVADGDTELRNTTQEGFENLTTEFRQFAETMAEDNSKALIEALEQVIRDFNTQLNEQFGENFKQLNEAVGALLIWQEQYKDHVEELTDQFQRSLDGIEIAKQALQEVATSAASIPERMEQLRDLMNKLDHQLGDMEQHLDAFANLKNSATDAFPIIETNLKNLTEGVSQSVNTSIEKMSGVTEAQSVAVEGVREGFSKLKSAMESELDGLVSSMTKAVEETTGQFSSSIDNHHEGVRSAISRMEQGIDEAIKETNVVLGKQINELDQQMQDEVTRVVGVMGSNLASLSAKFVEDYGPLTERLKDLIEISRRHQ